MRRTPPPSHRPTHLTVTLVVAALLVSCSGGDASTEGEALALPTGTETGSETETDTEPATPLPGDDAPLAGSPTQPLAATTDEAADAGAIETTCAALARAGHERARNFPAPDDHAGLVAFITDEASRYEDIATPMRAIGSRREVRRAEILEAAATGMRDFSSVLAEVLSTGRPTSPEELPALEEHLAWLEDVKVELLMWRAHTCDDVPGVTRSEIKGIPHVRLEVDEETGWPEPIDATD